jgi:hypothetical protein
MPSVFFCADRVNDDDPALSDISVDNAAPEEQEGNIPTPNDPSLDVRVPKSNNTKKKNLVKFTLAQKRHILSLAYPTNGPTRVRQVAQQYGVVHGTISNWKVRFGRLALRDVGYGPRVSYRSQTMANVRSNFTNQSTECTSHFLLVH